MTTSLALPWREKEGSLLLFFFFVRVISPITTKLSLLLPPFFSSSIKVSFFSFENRVFHQGLGLIFFFCYLGLFPWLLTTCSTNFLNRNSKLFFFSSPTELSIDCFSYSCIIVSCHLNFEHFFCSRNIEGVQWQKWVLVCL